MTPENIGQQFKDHVLLHRGIPCVGPECVAAGGLGIHWSKDEGIADRFADWNEDADDEHSPDEDHGVVVSALVHKDNIIKPNSPEWNALNERGNQIFGEDHFEQERTVRPGSKVHVVAITHADGRNRPAGASAVTQTKPTRPIETTA
jgi:hypothetical protein